MTSNTTKVSAKIGDKTIPHRDAHPAHHGDDATTMQLRLRLAEASGQVQNTGWLVELMQTIAASDRFATACHELTSQLQTHLNVVRIVLGWQGNRRSQRVVSVSGVPNQDKHSEEVRLYQSCLDEAIVRGSLGIWPSVDENVDSMLSHKQVAGRDREVFSLPLVTKTGTTVGSLLVIASRGQITTGTSTINFLMAAGSPIADVLASSERAEGSPLTKVHRWYRTKPLPRRIVIAGVCACGIASAWIPVHYKVPATSVIEPVQRRFCVAPHDGLVQQTMAQPGDVVEADQPIASMDGREVRWELAGLMAQHRRAAKQHDAHLATHNTSEAMQAELEMQRLQSQIDLMRYRESNLMLTAPIDGIVLSGSMDRRENFPVDQGQVIYEIAPLDELRIELNVASDDVPHISQGTTVEMMFAGFGSETFTATISKIRPQSEIREDQNVFVAECLLANHDGRLRPGMKGHAKIQGEKHPIGWIALHRAWEQVCMRTPW